MVNSMRICLALSNCKLWAVGRQTFQAIMMRAGIQKQTEHLELLRKYEQDERTSRHRFIL
jgi:hypothetical protein